MAASLSLRDRDDAPAPREGGCWILAAETDYLVRGPREMLRALGQEVPRSVADDLVEVVRLRFGNAVGRLELPGLGPVEVRSGKWSEEDFEAMLAQVAERSAALPFSAGSAASLPYDRGVNADEEVLYHAFVYLRHALSERAPMGQRLLPALSAILSDPHRLFRRERRWTELELATQVDARTLEGIACGLGGQRVRGERAHGALTIGGVRFPRRVDEACVRQTVDVPENRFVRAFLEQVVRVVDAMETLASEKGDPFRARVLAQCKDMRCVLEPTRRHTLWSEVGEMRRVPAESTVLQRRTGYREVLRHYVRMRLSSAVLPPSAVASLLELKDIASLYELWCYYEVERCVRDVLGRPELAIAPKVGGWQVSAGSLTVRWPSGVELIHEQTFSRGVSGRHSDSVNLRPDVTLRLPSGEVHLFDAKFRLNEKALADGVDKDARHADLHKMHAYRDAITRARSAWVLFPGDTFRFFGAGGPHVERPAELPARLAGIGAIPCRPDGATRSLSVVVSRLLVS